MTAWEAMVARLLDADGPEDGLVDPVDPDDGVREYLTALRRDGAERAEERPRG